MKIEYIAVYRVVEIDSKNKDNLRTSLEAHFRFNRKERKTVNDKVKNKIKDLRTYLEEKEGLEFKSRSNIFKEEYFSDKKREIWVKTLKNTRFNLKVYSNKEIPRKDMLDLDRLKDYINEA